MTPQIVTPEMYGAGGQGGTNDTDALQKAVATGNPVFLAGKYYITDAILCSTLGQKIYGIDRNTSLVFCHSDFNMNALGLFHFSQSVGPDLRDFTIQLFQDRADNIVNHPTSEKSAPTYDDIIQYPPAIYTQNVFGWSLTRMQIAGAWVGVDMKGNCGGVNISDLQISSFKYGFDVDGSLDTIHWDNVHGFNYGVSQYFQLVDRTIWFNIGKVDDFKVSNSMTLTGQAFNFFQGQGGSYSSGIANGSINQFDFDGSRIPLSLTAGNVSIAGGYMAIGTVAPAGGLVAISGGTLSITGTDIGFNNGGANSTTGNPFFDIGFGGHLTLTSTAQLSCQVDMPIARVASGGGLNIGLNDIVQQDTGGNLTYAKFIVDSGARINAIGNRINDRPHAGTLFQIASDDFHIVEDNCAPAWSNSFPTGPNGRYRNNSAFETPYPVRHDPSNSWSFDATANLVTVPQGGTYSFSSGEGFLLINDNASGQQAMVSFTAGACVIAFETGSLFQGNFGSMNNSGRNDGIANNGNVGFFYNGAYSLINNKGSDIRLGIVDFRLNPYN